MTELDVIAKTIKEAIEQREQAVINGSNIVDMEDYKFLIGVIYGLRGALDAVKAAQKRYEEE